MSSAVAAPRIPYGRLADGTIIPDDNPRELTLDERDLLQHIMRWGSDGYPVQKLGSRWIFSWRSIQTPTLYRTKREATEAFERYHEVLLYLSGQHARLAALRRSSS